MRRLPSLRRPIDRSRGFTLIEILIVVIILGILAGIVIPQFSSATTDSRQATVKEDLRYLRTQIAAFKYQHRDVTPGYPGGDVTVTPDEATFLSQMTRFTDERCNMSESQSTAARYGPYLTQMPPNPMNLKTGVLVVAGQTMPPADESQPYGWIYNAETEKIAVNLAGNDSAGMAWSAY